MLEGQYNCTPSAHVPHFAWHWNSRGTFFCPSRTYSAIPYCTFFSISSPLWDDDDETEEYSTFSWNEIFQNDKINLKFYFHEEISRMKHVKDAKSEKNIKRRNRIRKWMRKSAKNSNNTLITVHTPIVHRSLLQDLPLKI